MLDSLEELAQLSGRDAFIDREQILDQRLQLVLHLIELAAGRIE